MNNAILQLSGLTKGYNHGKPNEVRVLRGIDLTIAKGEVVALVAPSGTGKSTLLHIAGLLDSADAGTVQIAGRDMTRADDSTRTDVRRVEIGFIYQFHHLLPEFSALENIVIPQRANGAATKTAEARAMDLLDRVGLSSRAHHRPAELSGGEQQRVAFCRALANAPICCWRMNRRGTLTPKHRTRCLAR